MDEFYKKIEKQLNRMTEAEKDSWILSQAKIEYLRNQEGYKHAGTGRNQSIL